jgi:hypothetical protein
VTFDGGTVKSVLNVDGLFFLHHRSIRITIIGKCVPDGGTDQTDDNQTHLTRVSPQKCTDIVTAVCMSDKSR